MANLKAEVEEKIRRILSDSELSWAITRMLVERAAYWHGHPSGRPAHAPKHARRLEEGVNGWEIEFGANRFLAERALHRCLRAVLEELETERVDTASLSSTMDFLIRRSVANYAHEEYESYWDAPNGFMRFGTQAIHVPSVITFIQQICELRKLK